MRHRGSDIYNELRDVPRHEPKVAIQNRYDAAPTAHEIEQEKLRKAGFLPTKHSNTETPRAPRHHDALRNENAANTEMARRAEAQNLVDTQRRSASTPQRRPPPKKSFFSRFVP